MRCSTLSQLLAVLILASPPAWAAGNPGDLFSAADKGDARKISQALSSGIDVNTPDPDGWTALMVAASTGKLDAVKVLVKAGANVNATSKKGETPLMAAVLSGDRATVQYLLDQGADPSAASAQGLTAADIAQRSKNQALADLLNRASAPPPPKPTYKAPGPASSKSVAAKTERAIQAFQAGDYAEAAELFRDVTRQDKDNALVWHFLGQSLSKSGDLMGARKAYAKALEVAPEGDIAKRTRDLLAKLPLPDPAKILLPSGLTLYDELSGLDERLKKEPKSETLLKDVAGWVDKYGPYPQLEKVQKTLLRALMADIKVNDAAQAKANLPRIKQLRSLLRDSLDLLRQEGLALHWLGHYEEAKGRYSEWLVAAGAKAPGRAGVVENIQRAGRGEAPKALPDIPLPEMVAIPAGYFQRGEDVLAKPVHGVRVTTFALSKTEVTFDQYDAFAQATDRQLPNDKGWGRGDRPVIDVSWEDAQAYVRWLAEQTGEPYRLPSEAEWEYAARAGSTTAYWWGDQASREYMNYGKDECCGGHASGRDQWEHTAPVAQFPANSFGLHDMHGNVWEWVEDCWNESYAGAPSDGRAWLSGDCSRRVLRGGGWYSYPADVRSAIRGRFVPSLRFNLLGFRVARTLP